MNAAARRFADFIKRRLADYDKLDRVGITRWPREAAALSYYMALSVAPFLAICFALAKSFGLEEALMTSLTENFAGQENILGPMKEFAENLIRSFSGSLLAFVALAVIFWSGYRLLAQLEATLGVIFGYRPPRVFWVRATSYLSIFFTVPFLLIAAGAINVYLTGMAQKTWGSSLLHPESVAPALLLMSPYLLWWTILAWAYAYFSRGLMRWPERLLGGLCAGVLFQLFQAFYLKIMFTLTSYNAIYGSFAAVPLFMVWLYSSWLIVMLGAEVTRRFSDRFTAGRPFFSLTPPSTWAELRNLARRVIREVQGNYEAAPEGQATGMRQLSRATRAPLPMLGFVVTMLIEADVLALVRKKDEGGPAFLMSRSRLTEERVIEILEDHALYST